MKIEEDFLDIQNNICSLFILLLLPSPLTLSRTCAYLHALRKKKVFPTSFSFIIKNVFTKNCEPETLQHYITISLDSIRRNSITMNNLLASFQCERKKKNHPVLFSYCLLESYCMLLEWAYIFATFVSFMLWFLFDFNPDNK